jgi:hypothetical protein
MLNNVDLLFAFTVSARKAVGWEGFRSRVRTSMILSLRVDDVSVQK